jgi:predicted DNA-binding transcriptional regulator YafY
VYRDISALSEAGVPIAGEAGVGYSLMKGYQLPPVMFTAEEATSLFVGGELVKQFTDASLQAPMVSALEKLRAVLPRDRQEHVERLVRNTLVMGRGNNQPDPAAQPWLLQVQQGVVQRRVLHLVYRAPNRDEDTMRDVEPLGVVYHSGAWYLVAWCRLRLDFRHFRVDRIRRLDMKSETFPPRQEFSLAKHMEQSVPAHETIAVRVWFDRRAAERARRESYATLIEEKKRDGGAEYSLYSFSLEWMARWLLSFGDWAEAVEPPELRAKVRELVAKVAEKHA